MNKKMDIRNIVIFVLSLSIVILLIVGVISFTNYNKQKEEKPDYEQMDVNGKEVRRLFLLTREDMNAPLFIGSNYSNLYYTINSFYIDDIGEEFKMDLAFSKLDNSYITIKNKRGSFKASYLKNIYKEVFGDMSNYQDGDFYYGCPSTMEYNEKEEIYEFDAMCGIGSLEGYENEIVEAKKYNDHIEIYEKVVFYDYIGDNTGRKYYYDVYYKTPIGNTYDFNSDDVQEYKYIFKKLDDGNYYFYGVERQK